MRGLMFACAAVVALFLSATPARASRVIPVRVQTMSAPVATALQVPDNDKKIDVTIGEHGNAWYRSPVWMAIGVLALIVLVILIVMMTRSGGGGTTIIRQ